MVRKKTPKKQKKKAPVKMKEENFSDANQEEEDLEAEVDDEVDEVGLEEDDNVDEERPT